MSCQVLFNEMGSWVLNDIWLKHMVKVEEVDE